MNKRILLALLLIALSVIVMLLNNHSTTFILIGKSTVNAAFVYLGFMIAGIVTGMLLR